MRASLRAASSVTSRPTLPNNSHFSVDLRQLPAHVGNAVMERHRHIGEGRLCRLR